MDQASPDFFQDLSVRTTAHEKLRVAHALAELCGAATLTRHCPPIRQ